VFLLCVVAGSSIRLKGRNLTECEHIKLGAYHTLELEPQRAFSVAKACWDSLDIERLRSACDPQASADLAALLITVSVVCNVEWFVLQVPVCVWSGLCRK
jgi:protein pelota